jgi:hypothetical protein
MAVRDLRELVEEHPDANPRSAARFEIFICPACPNAHVVLFDSKDEPFAQMTVGPVQFDVIEGACLDVFEQVKKQGGK